MLPNSLRLEAFVRVRKSIEGRRLVLFVLLGFLDADEYDFVLGLTGDGDLRLRSGVKEMGERRFGGDGVSARELFFNVDGVKDNLDILLVSVGESSRTGVGVPRGLGLSGRWNPASSLRERTFRRGGLAAVDSLVGPSSSRPF
jgi:hypothetical protein